ncbi:MAG: DUF2189 domain-containing protein [Alphaproteobacteria bacterium]
MVQDETYPITEMPLPRIRAAGVERPWTWLAAGWEDLWRTPGVSLAYGAIITALSFALTAGLYWANAFFLLLPLAAGFMLMAPILAVGLYEISRRHETNEPVTITTALFGFGRHGAQLAGMGVVLMIFLLAWMRLATLIFALFFVGDAPPWESFIATVFFSIESIPFLIVGTAIGAVVAFFVFAISAVSIPMILDRDTNAIIAVLASLTAVRYNLKAMLVWASLIVLFTTAGLVTGFLGLVITLPLIGHATWHAYKDLIQH